MPAPTARPLRQGLPGRQFILFAFGASLLATLLLLALASAMTDDRPVRARMPDIALVIHIATVVPALLLGAVIVALRKGSALHKRLGRVWATLMMITALSSFWLQGLTGHLSPIHIFSVITLVSIPVAIWRARAGDIAGHKRAMLGPYIGLLVAGLFAFLPGRLLGTLLFGLL